MMMTHAGVAAASPSDWSDDARGATYVFSNRAAAMHWENPGGDWLDATGTKQGETPFATFLIERDATRVSVDVTTLVQQWATEALRADGFHLRSKRGTANLHSREAVDANVRPTLELDTEQGLVVLQAEADTALASSSATSLGDRVSYGLGTVLLRFPREAMLGRTVSAARLVLHRLSPSGGDTEMEVFASRPPRAVYPVEHGLAAGFQRDQGIEGHAAVLTAVNFSGDSWTRSDPRWATRTGTLVDSNSSAEVANGFVELDGPAMRWGFRAGENGGTSANYSLLGLPEGERPEELYSRYYVRFGTNFTPTVDGGKLPGFAYRPGGAARCNGGSPDTTGTVCWSARGTFAQSAPVGNTLAGHFGLGYYVYHPGQSGPYGSVWQWNQGYDAMVTSGRWYAVEEHVRMNTPGTANGVLRAWVNGRRVFEKTDVLFRNNATLQIGQVWYDTYHGGTATAPHDMHFWVDNLVVATSYIGPMGGMPDAPSLLDDGEEVDPGTEDPDAGATSSGGGGGGGGNGAPGSSGSGGGGGGASSGASGAGGESPGSDDDEGGGCQTSTTTGMGLLPLLMSVWLVWRRRRAA